MNRHMVLYTLGYIAMAEAALLSLPLVIAVIYKEAAVITSLLATIIIALLLGLFLRLVAKPANKVIYAKEGFVIVAFAWTLMSLIGAIPFTLSGEIPSYIDAVFETVSGFTTTGASILTDVEAMSKGLLFWRSFTHWVGGMGVLVFVMAIVPNIADRSIHIMRAEMPGPVVGKLVPKARDTAKILYLIYIAMTALLIILLMCGGMPLFESIVHAFGTAGTGGFGVKADSLGGYSPYLQWVITIFMILFGINFNLYYLILIGRIKAVLKSTELWFYIGIIAASVSLITYNIFSIYQNFADALRQSSFQVASIISTTGYATTDFDLWPGLSKAILLILMLVGACAGSTAGGLKVSRLVILLKAIKREFKKMLHPRSVRAVSMEEKVMDDTSLSSVTTYFAVYMMCIVGIFLLLSFEPFSIETNLSATFACFNNIGPGLDAVGPAMNYSEYSALSKILLSFSMLLGRLEIYPIILGLNPLLWKKR